MLLNSFKEGIVFEDIVFLKADNAEKCNKNNTLILYTLDGRDALKFVEPLKVKMEKVSFFVSSIVPDRRGDDLPMVQGEQKEDEEKHNSGEPSSNLKTSLPDKDSDFVIYYLYNDPDSSSEEISDAFTGIQENAVNLILSGTYEVPRGSVIRPQLNLFPSSEKPEAAVLVFSVIRFESGDKKVVVRSFNRRFI